MNDTPDFQIYQTATGLKYALNTQTCAHLNDTPNALQVFERGIEFAESTPRLYLFLAFLMSSLLTTNIQYICVACIAFYVLGCFLSCSFRYMSTAFFSKIGIWIYGIFIWLSGKFLIVLSCVLLSTFRLSDFKIAFAYFAFCFLANFVYCTTIGTYARKSSLNSRYANLVIASCMMKAPQRFQ